MVYASMSMYLVILSVGQRVLLGPIDCVLYTGPLPLTCVLIPHKKAKQDGMGQSGKMEL